MKKVKLEFEEFQNEIKNEVKYHLDGGTPYRQETAMLSLEVALKTMEVELFLDRVKGRERVSHLFPQLDKDRKDDVAKMLRFIAKDMYLKKTTPIEVLEYRKKKSKNTLVLIPR